MRFSSVHPTDVPDEHAQAIFLAIADRWNSVSAAEIARAFAACSLYVNELPPSFRSSMTASGRYGVLLEGLAAGVHPVAFETDVEIDGNYAFSVAAATTQDELVREWSNVHHYGRRRVWKLAAAAAAFREREGEDYRAILARAQKLREDANR